MNEIMIIQRNDFEKIYKQKNTPEEEKRMMKKGRHFWIVVLFIFSLVSAASSIADTPTGDRCSIDTDCAVTCSLVGAPECYCLDNECYIIDGFEDTGLTDSLGQADGTVSSAELGPSLIVSPPSAVTTTAEVTELELQISLLEQKISSLETASASIGAQLADIASKISLLNSALTTIEAQQDQSKTTLESKISTVATGLAGLQSSVEKAQQELGLLEENVSEKPGISKIVFFTIGIIILIAGSLAILYLIEKIRHPGEDLGQDIVSYITHHIKTGKKYNHIKQQLVDAGWSHEQVQDAYKKTTKSNYEQYLASLASGSPVSSLPLSTTAPASPAPPSLFSGQTSETNPAKVKLVIIAVFSVLLIAGTILFLGSSAGQAIYLQQEIKETGELVNSIECTPPHILNEGKDSCCLDLNANEICDIREERYVPAALGTCNDNAQCASGKYCIDAQCVALDSLYVGSSSCDKLCNFYSVKVLTSDGETYLIKPGSGSYTAAGALEWEILSSGQHCNGERAVIPINLITKNDGKILEENVITLQDGDTSNVLTHPQLPNVNFQITIQEVFELCEEV